MRRIAIVLLLVAVACGGNGSGAPPASVRCTTSEPAPFPTPRQLTIESSRGVVVRSPCVEAGAGIDAQALAALASSARLAGPSSGLCDWRIVVGDRDVLGAQTAAALDGLGDGGERFAAVTRLPWLPETRVAAVDLRAARYALEELDALAPPSDDGSRCVAALSLVDGPAFPMRGVIEGFYGTPYTSDERRTNLDLMLRVRMNTYVYGPKDDPYSHVDWDLPYPAEQAAELARAVAEADARGIDFIWAISPGFPFNTDGAPGKSIRYSSDADFARLTAKLESIRALGVRRFALFLDDINEQLVWPEDRAAFASLPEAHAALWNRLLGWLRASDPSARLLAVGTVFSSIFDWRPYNEALAPRLAKGIDMMWTGTDVFSRTLSPADFAAPNAVYGQRLILWDNWPIEVSGYSGRSGDLASAVGGIVANPVLNENGAHPTVDFWRVLGTIGDYSWNPEAYDAGGSFARWQALLP